MTNGGKIIFFTGCMYSGKSSNLLRKLVEFGESYECFKPAIDTRDGDFIVSRDESALKVLAKRIANIEEVLKSKAKIIALDEIQFFTGENFTETMEKLKNNGKIVLLGGLDRIATGEFWDIYPLAEKLADEVIKLTAICDVCGAVASYSKKISGSSAAVEIEGSDVKYIPVCERCFYDR